MLMLIQKETTEPQIQIAQETVIAIIVASTVVVLGLLWLIGRFAFGAPADEGPLHYGNFFVVVFGIMTVLIGYLVAFALVISNVFTDPTQEVIALLSALFGTVVGLVGTYFGVKSSRDASQKAQGMTERAHDLALEATHANNAGTNDEPVGKPNGDACVPAGGRATEGTARRSSPTDTVSNTGERSPQGDGRDPGSPLPDQSGRDE